jgi:hypothetical protein
MQPTLSKFSLSLLFISILSLATSVVFAANPNNSWFTTEFEYDLVAGKSMDVGDISLSLDETLDQLTIQVTTSGGWLLAETHIHVATPQDGIPQKNGNPIPGQFDDTMEHAPPVDTYTQTFPVPETGTVLIAIHAVVQLETNCETDEETAWGGWCTGWTRYFPGSNWAIYIEYPVS